MVPFMLKAVSNSFKCLIALVLLSITLPAYAYLDPGTGSVLLQGLLAGIAGSFAIVKLYWRRLKGLCLRLCPGSKKVAKPITVAMTPETKSTESNDAHQA